MFAPNRYALLAITSAFALTLSAESLQSQTADPAADLEAIRVKAETSPYLEQMFRQLTQQSQPDPSRRLLRQIMRNGADGQEQDFTKPYHFGDLAKVQTAQQRAGSIAAMLSADLDNDGQVTKEELKAALQFGRNGPNSAASAFFSSDANDDGILSAEEIRSAANLQTGRSQGNFGQTTGMAALFDFDGDEILTPEEFARGQKALGL